MCWRADCPCPGLQVAAGALNFVLGFGCVTASYTMSLIPKTQATQAWLVHVFRLCPPFLLGEGLIELTRVEFTRSIAAATGQGAPTHRTLPPTQNLPSGPAQNLPSGAPATAAAAELGAACAEGAAWVGSVFDFGVLLRPIIGLAGEAALLGILVLVADAATRGALSVPLLAGATPGQAGAGAARSCRAHTRGALPLGAKTLLQPDGTRLCCERPPGSAWASSPLVFGLCRPALSYTWSASPCSLPAAWSPGSCTCRAQGQGAGGVGSQDAQPEGRLQGCGQRRG